MAGRFFRADKRLVGTILISDPKLDEQAWLWGGAGSNNMKSELSDFMRRKFVPAIWGTFAFLLVALFRALLDAIPSEYLRQIQEIPLLIPLGIALLLIVLLLLLLGLLLKEKKLELRDGLYWDSENNVYCPACQSPVTFEEAHKESNETCYFCMKCDKRSYVKGIHSDQFFD